MLTRPAILGPPGTTFRLLQSAKVRPLIGRCVVLLMLMATATPTLTSPLPAGREFQVNADIEAFFERSTSVAMAPNGSFVVVWSRMDESSDPTDISIQAKRYASDGSPIDGQFQITTYPPTVGNNNPRVSVAEDGRFVVVWENYGGSYGTDTSYLSIQGKRYESNGSPMGDQFQVNTYTTSFQDLPSVSVHPEGHFLVVWRSQDSSTPPFASIKGQRYASDGSSLGGEFRVSTESLGSGSRPSVSTDPNGGFVVVWSSFRAIKGQRYASDGSTNGGQFQVNTYTTISQNWPSVSVNPEGSFVVVWQSEGSPGNDTSLTSIQGRRYASDGSPIGDQFQVNTYTFAYQRLPEISVAPDGDFVVVWSGYGNGADTDIHGQLFASDGTYISGQFLVNTYTLTDHNAPSISMDSNGDFVVVWMRGVFGRSIHGQRYTRSCIFADGFESGDISMWFEAANIRRVE